MMPKTAPIMIMISAMSTKTRNPYWLKARAELVKAQMVIPRKMSPMTKVIAPPKAVIAFAALSIILIIILRTKYDTIH